MLWIKYGGTRYACYDMPRPEEGNVEVHQEDYIKEFQLDVQPFTSSGQDHLYKNGKIILVSGVPNTGELLAFISIDENTGTREAIINLKEYGLKEEPESITIYNGKILIGGRGNIYKVNFYSIE